MTSGDGGSTHLENMSRVLGDEELHRKLHRGRGFQVRNELGV